MDDEDILVESGSILSWEECVQEGNWTGGPSSFNNTKTSFALYLPAPVPSTLPLASVCAAIVTNKDATLSPTNLPTVFNSVVTLRSTTIYKMEAAFLQHAKTLAREQHSPISASEATVSAAAGATSSKVAILNSRATHHLWSYYKASSHTTASTTSTSRSSTTARFTLLAKEPSPLKWRARI